MPLIQRPAPALFRAEETTSDGPSRRAFLKLGCSCCAMLAAPQLAFGQTPSPDVAIIAYEVRQTVTLKGEPKELHAADLSTWIRGEDGWACHAHTEPLIEDKPKH